MSWLFFIWKVSESGNDSKNPDEMYSKLLLFFFWKVRKNSYIFSKSLLLKSLSFIQTSRPLLCFSISTARVGTFQYRDPDITVRIWVARWVRAIRIWVFHIFQLSMNWNTSDTVMILGLWILLQSTNSARYFDASWKFSSLNLPF